MLPLLFNFTTMSEQIGPKKQIIPPKPQEEYTSCYGCKFREHRMVKSGQNPTYVNNCTHDKAPHVGLFTGNLKNDNRQETPDWCPVLKEQS